MGRGLSEEQKSILGLAYSMNAATQDGVAAVKAGMVTPAGEPVAFEWWTMDGQRDDEERTFGVRVIDYRGAADVSSALAAHVVFGVPSVLHRPVRGCAFTRKDGTADRRPDHFRRQPGISRAPEHRAQLSSASRAIRRLERRGLIVHRPPDLLPLGTDGAEVKAFGVEVGDDKVRESSATPRRWVPWGWGPGPGGRGSSSSKDWITSRVRTSPGYVLTDDGFEIGSQRAVELGEDPLLLVWAFNLAWHHSYRVFYARLELHDRQELRMAPEPMADPTPYGKHTCADRRAAR